MYEWKSLRTDTRTGGGLPGDGGAGGEGIPEGGPEIPGDWLGRLLYDTEPSLFLIGLEATWGDGFDLSELIESFRVNEFFLTSAGGLEGPPLPCLGRVEANLLPVDRSLTAMGSNPKGPAPAGAGAGAGLGLGGWSSLVAFGSVCAFGRLTGRGGGGGGGGAPVVRCKYERIQGAK